MNKQTNKQNNQIWTCKCKLVNFCPWSWSGYSCLRLHQFWSRGIHGGSASGRRSSYERKLHGNWREAGVLIFHSQGGSWFVTCKGVQKNHNLAFQKPSTALPLLTVDCWLQSPPQCATGSRLESSLMWRVHLLAAAAIAALFASNSTQKKDANLAKNFSVSSFLQKLVSSYQSRFLKSSGKLLLIFFKPWTLLKWGLRMIWLWALKAFARTS